MVPGVGGSLRFQCRSGRLPLVARSEFALAARISGGGGVLVESVDVRDELAGGEHQRRAGQKR